MRNISPCVSFPMTYYSLSLNSSKGKSWVKDRCGWFCHILLSDLLGRLYQLTLPPTGRCTCFTTPLPTLGIIIALILQSDKIVSCHYPDEFLWFPGGLSSFMCLLIFFLCKLALISFAMLPPLSVRGQTFFSYWFIRTLYIWRILTLSFWWVRRDRSWQRGSTHLKVHI